jgi:hypothetical protein
MATSGLVQRFSKQPKPLDGMKLTRSWDSDGRDFIGDVDWAMLQGNQQQQQQDELGGGGDEDKEMCPQQCACGGRGRRAEESPMKQRRRGRRPSSLLDADDDGHDGNYFPLAMPESSVLDTQELSGLEDLRCSYDRWPDGKAVYARWCASADRIRSLGFGTCAKRWGTQCLRGLSRQFRLLASRPSMFHPRFRLLVKAAMFHTTRQVLQLRGFLTKRPVEEARHHDAGLHQFQSTWPSTVITSRTPWRRRV